jgi:hypothetical protein
MNGYVDVEKSSELGQYYMKGTILSILRLS